MTKNRQLIIPAVILGIVLIVIAIVYWVSTASGLPSFFPGHQAGSSTHHVKHGIAAFLLGSPASSSPGSRPGRRGSTAAHRDAKSISRLRGPQPRSTTIAAPPRRGSPPPENAPGGVALDRLNAAEEQVAARGSAPIARPGRARAPPVSTPGSA